MAWCEKSACIQDTAGLQCKAGARLDLLLHTNSCCTSEKAALAHSCIYSIGKLSPEAALLALDCAADPGLTNF